MDTTVPDTSPGSSLEKEHLILANLRAGDETAFSQLVQTHHRSLYRLARLYVSDHAAAEEVVQETWLGFLESLARFEGRASIKTWLCRILLNCARARARRDGRTVPFSDAFDDIGVSEPAVEGRRFFPRWLPGIGGHWRTPPARLQDEPEQQAIASETRASIRRSIESLPPNQREVILLRDIAGCSASETCNVLGVSDTNQRVLLHRARSSVRRSLERMGYGAARAVR
jgi:RNA polymerase sigma-70 factor (ECF subfamily)